MYLTSTLDIIIGSMAASDCNTKITRKGYGKGAESESVRLTLSFAGFDQATGPTICSL